MRPAVMSIQEDVPVRAAARTMQENGIGALIVMSGNRLVGIASERDIVFKVIAVGTDPGAVEVREVMTTRVQVAHPDDSLEGTISRMQEGRFRHMPVIENERLVGIVSLADIARLVKTTESVSAYRTLAQLVAALSERRVEVGSESKAAE
jgi:CBS domain-containing protein